MERWKPGFQSYVPNYLRNLGQISSPSPPITNWDCLLTTKGHDWSVLSEGAIGSCLYFLASFLCCGEDGVKEGKTDRKEVS